MGIKENIFTGDKQGPWLLAAMVFLALVFTFLAMGPSLDNGFTNWDEYDTIVRNPRIRTLSAESVKTIFSTPDISMYNPLAILSYAVEYHFAGLAPEIYHATNLFLHLANTVLVLLLARLLLGGAWGAFFVALLFGVHPAHVESVAWAAERKDVLCAFFYLSSLLAYASRPGKTANYLLSLVLFVLALLSKSMAVTLPLALLLVDYLKEEKVGLKHWLGKLPFFICAGIFTGIQLYWSGGTFGMSAGKRLLVPLYNLGFYIYTLLWPFNLSAMYYFPLGGRTGVYLFAAGVLAAAFLLWKYFRRDKELIFGAAFYAALLLPVLQFFPFGGVVSSDRYTYLSSIGVFIAAAALARRALPRLGPAFRPALAVCALCAVLVLAVTSRVRCAVWKDSVSLWNDTLRKQPLAPLALTNLCDAYLSANRAEEAAACVDRAMRQYPENKNNQFNACRLLVLADEPGRAKDCFAKIDLGQPHPIHK